MSVKYDNGTFSINKKTKTKYFLSVTKKRKKKRVSQKLLLGTRM